MKLMFAVAEAIAKRWSQGGNSLTAGILLTLLLGPILVMGTLAVTALKLYLSPVWDLYWSIGWIGSLALSLLICILTIKEGALRLSRMAAQAGEKQAEIEHVQKEFETFALKAHGEQVEMKSRIEAMKEQLKQTHRRAESFEELVSLKKYAWESLEEEKEALFQEKVSLEQALMHMEEEKVFLQEQMERSRMAPHPYEELKKQFEEKAATLNAMRKEFYELEGKYLALQKEFQELTLDLNEDKLALLRECRRFEERCLALEEEVNGHQDLVTQLSLPATSSKKKKGSPKKGRIDASVLDDLFQTAAKAKPYMNYTDAT